MSIDAAPAPFAPYPEAPFRQTGGVPLFIEDFQDGILGMFNDGIGGATLDDNIRLNGRATVRLDPQMNVSPASGALVTNSSTVKISTGANLDTVTPQTLIGAVINSGTPTLPASGYFQVIGSDANTYIGTYTGQSYNTGTLTLTGCLLLPGATAAQVGAAPGTKIFGQVGGATPTCTVPVWSTGPTLGLLIVGNPWVNCGVTPDTNSVIFKRRIVDNFSRSFGCGIWVRFTSSKSAGASAAGNGSGIASACWSASLYNRDGANAYYTRIMLQTNVMMADGTAAGNQSPDNAILWVATSGTTSAPILTPLAIIAKQSFNQHSYDPPAGSWDKAGIWHFAKMVVDFANHNITSVQFNDLCFNFGTALPVPVIVAAGSAKVMHFSTEFKQGHASGNTDVRTWVNIGPITGTLE